AIQPYTICANKTFNLADLNGTNDGGIFTWYANDFPPNGTLITADAVTTNTTYYLVYGNNGCTATATAEVTIAAPPSFTVTANPIDACEGDLLTLSAYNGPESGTFTWFNGLPYLSNTITTITAVGGSSVWVLYNENGCTDSLQVSINTVIPPTIDVLNTAIVCSTTADGNSEIDLDSLIAASTSGVWSGSLPSGASGTLPNIDFDGALPGVYTFTYTVNSPPCAPVSADVVINVQNCACPDVNILPPPILCANSVNGSFDLSTIQPNEPGNWKILAAPFGLPGAFFAGKLLEASNPPGGNYPLAFTLAIAPPPGCPAANTVVVTVNAPANAGTGQSIVLCTTDSNLIILTDFLVDADAGGTWSLNSGSANPATDTFDPVLGIFVAQGNIPSTFIFDYTVAGTTPCPNQTTTVTITLEAQASAGSGGSLEVCNNNTLPINLFDLLSNADPGGTWALTSGNLDIPLTPNNMDFTNHPPGTLIFTYTQAGNSNCAPDETTVSITIAQFASAGTASTPLDLCNTESTTLNLFDLLANEATGGTWTVTSGTPDAGAFNATSGTFDPLNHSAGSYSFTYTITNAPPCPNDSETITVNIFKQPNAGSDIALSVCNDAAGIINLAQLINAPDVGGVWTNTGNQVISGSFDALNASFNPINHPAGIYTFVYSLTSTAPCAPDEATVTVTIEALPTATVIGAFACNGISTDGPSMIDLDTLVTMGADPNGVWTAITPGAPVVPFGNPLVDFNGINPGNYTYQYCTGNAVSPCQNQCYTATIVVQNCDCPIVATLPILPVCTDFISIDLMNYVASNADPGSWSLGLVPVGSTVSIDISGLLTGNNTPAGNYEVIYTLTTPIPGCPDASSQVFDVVEPPNAGNNNTATLCNNSNMAFDLNTLLGGADAGGSWALISGVVLPGSFDAASGQLNPLGQIAGSIIFSYTVSGGGICPDATATVTINITPAPDAGVGGSTTACNNDATPIDLTTLVTGYTPGGT
ncbi:MAG TPA: hypothetical protein PKD56_05475, partial [Chitinophagales bacterium]|nr:hypothetical protein [Chitinophagales bacterium]